MTLFPGSPSVRRGVVAVTAALFVLTSASAAFGQARRADDTTLMVAGGVNIARLSLPFPDFDFDEIPVTLENGSRTGFVGGVLADVAMAPRAGFLTGALYSERGAHMNADVLGFGVADVDFRMTYLDVPLLARYRVSGTSDRGFSVLAGGMAGIRLHARTRASAFGESASDTFTDELPAFDFGVTIGGRGDFGRASVTGYYTQGLTDLTKGLSPDAIRHRVFTIMAGWRF